MTIMATGSHGSVASSHESRIYDAPRKRREFPRRANKPNPSSAQKPPMPPIGVSNASMKSSPSRHPAGSISHSSLSASLRPPPSPRSNTSHSRRLSNADRARSQSPSTRANVHPRTKGAAGYRSKPRARSQSPNFKTRTRSRSPSKRSRRSPSPGSRHKNRSRNPKASSSVHSQRSRTSPPSSHSGRASPGSAHRRPPIPASRSRNSSDGERIPRPRSMSRSSLDSAASSRVVSNRDTFHVRVSLGYLTGIKIDELGRRKKKKQHNMLVLGYASLAKSGKQVAFSQPLVPSLVDGKKPAKLFWTDTKARRQGSVLSKTLRRLYFSLKLERDIELESRTEEDSLDSQSSYTPQVVKLLVGLKFGEEKLPLGLVNLVINGNERMGQKTDLAVRPVTEELLEDSQRQNKPMLGIFGGNKKHHSVSFANHDHEYRLASNATLRVRVDVKSGIPGESKATVWGDGDDASQVTNWTYDTRDSFAKSMSVQGSIPLTQSSSMVVLEQGNMRGLHQQKDGALVRSNNAALLDAPKDGTLMQAATKPLRHKLPVNHILVDVEGGASMISDLTNPSPGFSPSYCLGSCFRLNWSGESKLPVEPPYSNSYSFEQNRDRQHAWDEEEKGERSSEHPDRWTSFSGESSSRGWNAQTRSPSNTRATSSERSNRSPAPNSRGFQSIKVKRSLDGSHTTSHKTDEDSETVDITVETYTDLKDAQDTLLRYASKVGINMEDLLEDMESEKREESFTKTT